jgi:hypothetical protein
MSSKLDPFREYLLQRLAARTGHESDAVLLTPGRFREYVGWREPRTILEQASQYCSTEEKGFGRHQTAGFQEMLGAMNLRSLGTMRVTCLSARCW